MIIQDQPTDLSKLFNVIYKVPEYPAHMINNPLFKEQGKDPNYHLRKSIAPNKWDANPRKIAWNATTDDILNA